MGTRSLTHIFADGESNEAVLTTIYRQYDGYPTGHGQDLLDLMKDRTIINGIPVGADTSHASNGMGCFAATVIQELKTESGIGGIYLEPPGTEDHGEEFVYSIAERQGILRLKVEMVSGGWGDTPRTRKVLFAGNADDFDPKAAEEKANE